MQIALIKYNFSEKDTYILVPDEVKANDKIIIDTTRGLLLAEVYKIVENGEIDNETKHIRLATDEDIAKVNKLQTRAIEKKDIVVKLFQKYHEGMKFVDMQYTIDESKVIISFVCEDRVDFRELVKELAIELKARIELRQVGIRDQAKKIGCMGICGKECCCKQYLNDFDKVSIKMAKSQNLSLNPTKISGTCGRLMCCLAFENETYVELGKSCPKIGAKVTTPDGDGTVLSNDVLRQTSFCRVEKGDEVKVANYPVESIKVKKDKDSEK